MQRSKSKQDGKRTNGKVNQLQNNKRKNKMVKNVRAMTRDWKPGTLAAS
jgi:hypothetical protein